MPDSVRFEKGRHASKIDVHGALLRPGGVFEFAVKEWGPQPSRLILSSIDCNAVSLRITKDVSVKEAKDMVMVRGDRFVCRRGHRGRAADAILTPTIGLALLRMRRAG